MTQIQQLNLDQEQYPPLLKQIHDPPEILYVLGKIQALTTPCIAMVGSRSATNYGKKYAQIFASELAQSGFTIVSGLAFGVDSWSHEAALEQGSAVGVIAGGLNAPLQSWQRGIVKKILANDGAIISEYPPHLPALKHHFPQRNRIIAGLAYATLVIEARQKSGALITAKAATEAGRTVFTLPGDIDRPTSLGCLELIRRGAVPISSALEVKRDLQGQLPLDFLKAQANTPQEQVLALLEKQPLDAHNLAKQLNMSAAILLKVLTKLELSGQIVHTAENSYALKI